MASCPQGGSGRVGFSIVIGFWREFSMGKRAIIQHGLGYAFTVVIDLGFVTACCCGMASIGVYGREHGISQVEEGSGLKIYHFSTTCWPKT
jgi:hypothetical protein